MKKFLNAPLSNVVSLIACVALVLATLYGGLMHGELAPLTLGGVTAGASNLTILQVGNGTASIPSLSFTSDTDTGLYRVGANNVGLAIGGTKILDVASTGLAVTGTLSSSGAFTATGALDVNSTSTISGTMTFDGTGDLDLSTNIVENIGNAGTDFDTNGGLTLAGPLDLNSTSTVSGTMTFNGTGTLDPGANVISNVGNSGTDFDASGGLTLASGVTISNGNLRVNDLLIVDLPATLTVTTVITPSQTFLPISSAGPVSPTITATGVQTGTVLYIWNAGSQNIQLTDTGTQVQAGDFVMGANDLIEFIFDGTNWLELARSNN